MPRPNRLQWLILWLTFALIAHLSTDWGLLVYYAWHGSKWQFRTYVAREQWRMLPVIIAGAVLLYWQVSGWRLRRPTSRDFAKVVWPFVLTLAFVLGYYAADALIHRSRTVELDPSEIEASEPPAEPSSLPVTPVLHSPRERLRTHWNSNSGVKFRHSGTAVPVSVAARRQSSVLSLSR